MEPRQPGLSGGFEHRPTGQSQGGEFAGAGNPEQKPFDVESGVESRPEMPARVEHEPSAPAFPSLPAPLVPVNDDGAVASPAAPAVDDTTMLSAEDQDLIEKEWIDKAKKIINETKEDPYRREKEVSKLQIEYIRKRYGREIGQAGSQ